MGNAIGDDERSLLDSVFGSRDQGVLVVRKDLSVPYLNARAAKLIDLPPAFSIDPPNFRDILQYQVDSGAISEAYMVSRINDFILQGGDLTETQTYTRKTNEGRWLDVRTTPLPGGGFVRTFTDQTERHQIAAQKRNSDTAYKALFQNASLGIYRSDPQGRQIRANPELVALNGYHSENDLLAKVGDIAVEWYVDPQRRDEFKAILERDGRITNFESEVYRHLTRERIWISEAAWVVRDEDGEIVAYEGTVIDITERKKVEALVLHAAHHDALTGLANRASFRLELDAAIEGNKPFFLAYLDLDRFKQVNDSHGHGCGDNLLAAVAGRFLYACRAEDQVFRIGGDEFSIILSSTTLENAHKALLRLIKIAERPFNIDGIKIAIGLSIGLAHSVDSTDATELLHRADVELYRAKDMEGSAISYAEWGVDDFDTPRQRAAR